MENQNFLLYKGANYNLVFFVDDLPNLEDYTFTWVMGSSSTPGSSIVITKTSAASQIVIDSINRQVTIKLLNADLDYTTGPAAGEYWHEVWGTFTGDSPNPNRPIATGIITLRDSTRYNT